MVHVRFSPIMNLKKKYYKIVTFYYTFWNSFSILFLLYFKYVQNMNVFYSKFNKGKNNENLLKDLILKLRQIKLIHVTWTITNNNNINLSIITLCISVIFAVQ